MNPAKTFARPIVIAAPWVIPSTPVFVALVTSEYSPAFAVNGQFSSDQICLGFTPRAEKSA
jgi:hypothetical protein